MISLTLTPYGSTLSGLVNIDGFVLSNNLQSIPENISSISPNYLDCDSKGNVYSDSFRLVIDDDSDNNYTAYSIVLYTIVNGEKKSIAYYNGNQYILTKSSSDTIHKFIQFNNLSGSITSISLQSISSSSRSGDKTTDGVIHIEDDSTTLDDNYSVYTKTQVDSLLSTSIPTKLSDLNNDVGYITSYTETDPTVPSWAKSQSKPSYNLDEVSDGSTRKLSNYELKSNLKEGAYVDVDETSMTSSSTNLPTGKAIASYISGLNYITSSDIPTDISSFNNDVGYITSSSLPTVNNATLTIKKNNSDTGTTFTANASSDVTVNLGLATVALSGSYSDLSNKPTIPTVNDATLTIKKNSSDSGSTFTANASSDVTVNLGLALVATSGSYNDLTDKPESDYLSLIGKPVTIGETGEVGVVYQPSSNLQFPHYEQTSNYSTLNDDLVNDGWTLTNSWKTNNSYIENNVIYYNGDISGGSNSMYYKSIQSAGYYSMSDIDQGIINSGNPEQTFESNYDNTFELSYGDPNYDSGGSYNSRTYEYSPSTDRFTVSGYGIESGILSIPEWKFNAINNTNDYVYDEYHWIFSSGLGFVYSPDPQTYGGCSYSIDPHMDSSYTIDGYSFYQYDSYYGYWYKTNTWNSSTNLPYGGTEVGYFITIKEDVYEYDDITATASYVSTNHYYIFCDVKTLGAFIDNGYNPSYTDFDLISKSYYYNNPYSHDGINYTRDYYSDTGNVSDVYSPGTFFNYFSSKSSVSNKLYFATSGIGITPDTTLFTDTYDPETGSTSTGNEFRMVCTYTSFYGREPYDEYSHVANPINGLYDIHLKNTCSTSYIELAEYDGSWSTITNTIHGRVLIGTLGNENAIIVSDNNITINNNILPASTYSLGSYDNKWDSLYVRTLYVDNFEGISELNYNGSKKIEATDNGITVYGNILPSNNSNSIGLGSIKWNSVFATNIGSSSYSVTSGYISEMFSNNVLHAWGSGKEHGLRLCDGNYESTAYSSISGYQNGTNGQMIFHFYNASNDIEFSIENTGPNTENSSTTTPSLKTIPSEDGTWQLGDSSYKLGDIYCTTIHADTYDGISSGSADTLTTPRKIGVQNFNGSAAVNFCFNNTQSANTQSRTISATGYSLTEGVLIGINFKYSHSGSSIPTLNINSTGAFNLVDVSGENIKTWENDTQMFLYYDSTFQNTSNNKKYVVIWRSDTGVISSSGTGQDVGNVTFGTSSVTTSTLSTAGTVSDTTITPYTSVSVSGTNITDSLMKTIAWRFGGGVASYGQSDSNGSNVGAIGLFALRRTSPTSTGSISSIKSNNICSGSCLYQLEIHSTGLTSSTATATSISIHVFNYWRSGTWLILTPFLNNFSGMSIVLATQILA